MKPKRTSQATQVISIHSLYLPRNIYSLKNLFTESLFSLRSIFKNSRESFGTQPTVTNHKRQKDIKKLLPFALLLIIIGGVLLWSGRTVERSASATNTDERKEVKGPRAALTLNHEYSFPLLDAKGKELTRVTYTVETAELRDEIIVKGQRAVAIKGRTFLILNIKFANTYDKALSINARDYVRLSVNGNESELLAADIHNDPVSVQAISSKTTRLGFPINDTDTNLVLKIGEIKGDKESVPLKF